MNSVTLTITVLCLINFVTAYVYIQRVEKINGGCYHLDFGQIENKGVVYNDERCESLSCNADGVEALVHGEGCGSIGFDKENCKLVAGEGHYPSCCPSPVCKKPDEE
ncbi:toxin-like protein 14 [Limulus polyphemus]|uniref:Toxin-like protein 14 n=1 Tax=Limulus polyphemus TaxID=6850 RepID=A0ABM1B781_LIMPO|nr:toxin-like protein 14 [Limulus polyphemus]